MKGTRCRCRQKGWKAAQRLLVACAITLAACATNHPEWTWPPEIELTCEHPVIVGQLAATYITMRDDKGGPYIANPPYAIDTQGVRRDSLSLTSAAEKAGGVKGMIDGLSELPSESEALTASVGNSVGFDLALPAEPFYLLYEWYEGPVVLAKSRVEWGAFCHSYGREGGNLGCPRRAESNEVLKGYVYLPAAAYDQLFVEVNDPNLVTRSMTAKCSIK
jgi:hypothetical protein